MKCGKVLLILLPVLVVSLVAVTLPASAGQKAEPPGFPMPPVPEIPDDIVLKSLVLPQAPEDGPPADPLRVVAAFLQLSEEQVESLRELLEERHETVEPLARAIAERERLIQEQLNSSAPDPATIGQLVIEIHQHRQLIRQAQETFLQAFTSLLNEEQQRRYHALQMAERLQRFLPAFRVLRLL